MAITRFTLRQLEIFAAVVRTGQVKRAAEALHLSQGAVSQAIRELADTLDVALFERQGRTIVPTAAARQLLQLTAAPMATLDDIAGQFSPAGPSRQLTGDIRLAASSTITRYILPAALAALRHRHPALAITVISGNSTIVEERVAALDADIGFIEGPSQRDDLEVAAWGTDTLQIIAPHDYAADTVTIEALDAHPWVARERGSGTRAVFEQNLALAGYAAPRASLVIDDSGAIVRAVAAGAGLACVSRLAACQASSTAPPVQLIALEGLSLDRPMWCVRRASPGRVALVDQFRQLLDATLAHSR